MKWSAHDWLHASRSIRAEWQEEVSGALPDAFRARPLASGAPVPHAYLLPEFTHGPTGTVWVYLPGGSYRMGLSEGEEAAARRIEDPPPLNIEEMRPAHRVEVAPFLTMKTPVTWRLVEGCLGPRDKSQRPMFGVTEDLSPAYLTHPEIEELSGALGFALPTEAQWEYMCRADTAQLFFFGDDLPDDTLLSELVSGDIAKNRPNPFGLAGIFVGEWCRDRFRRAYNDPAETPDFVVRGGASAFWPWQGSEWAYCVSAMRMPSSDLIGGLCGGRFTLELKHS